MNANIFLRLRLLGPALALAAVVILTGLLARSDTAYAQPTFNPCGQLAPSDLSAGANSDIVSTFGVGIGADCSAIPADPSDTPDLQFAATVNFTPPEWGVYRDADMPDGALVAVLESTATLGLIGDGCSNILFPQFNMMDATTNMTTQVPFFDPEEEFDPPDNNDSQGAEPDDQFDIGPDGLPLGVTRYPDYLPRIFKDDADNTLTPITRLYGQTEVAGIDVSLNFVIFEPGTTFKTRAGEIRATDPRLGYPSATVLQAAGDPDTEPDIEANNSVSDFCSPLQADTTVFGVSHDNPDTAADEGGHAVRTNPPDGTYNFVTFAVSQYDADGDGIENMLDPCPTIANPNWDPREKHGSTYSPNPNYTGDKDIDDLPDELGCDPDPNVAGHRDPGGVSDEDHDRYGNRGDNCPLIANSKGQLGGIGADNQDDADLDQIGDACDPNPNAADGQRFEVCLVSQVTIGAGGPAPDPAPQNMRPCDPNAALGTLDDEDTPGNLTPGLTVPDSMTVGPGSSVKLDTTLADDNKNPRAGEDIVFEIKSQPGSDAGLVFAGIPRLGASNSTKANLEGEPKVTKVTDASGKAAATLNTGTTAGDIVISITGGGETKTITVTVSAEAPVATPGAADGGAADGGAADGGAADGGAAAGAATGGTTGTGGAAGGAATGVGSLAPIASSIPAWATIISALGGAGLLGSLGALAARIFGIRLPGRRD